MRGIILETPFAQYMSEHDLQINKLPRELQGTARRLRERPQKVGPNSPTLPRLADHLNVPLAQIQAFATGEPMTDQWVRKVETQLSRSTGGYTRKKAKRASSLGDRPPRGTTKPDGRRGPRRKRPGGQFRTSSLTKLIWDKAEMTLEDIARTTGLEHTMLWRLSSGDMAPNHPAVAVVAQATGIPVKVFQENCRNKSLEGRHLDRALKMVTKQLQSRNATNGTGTQLAVAKIEPSKRPGPTAGMRYNKLRGTADYDLRAAVRTMITSLNVAIMAGEDTTPPMPIAVTHVLVADYLDRLGLKQEYLLPPDFVHAFDPKE